MRGGRLRSALYGGGGFGGAQQQRGWDTGAMFRRCCGNWSTARSQTNRFRPLPNTTCALRSCPPIRSAPPHRPLSNNQHPDSRNDTRVSTMSHTRPRTRHPTRSPGGWLENSPGGDATPLVLADKYRAHYPDLTHH